MSLTIGTPDSATISTTEYSLFADSAGPTAQTPDLEKAYVHLDLNALAAGDRFVYKWYEKVNGAGTQRVTRQGYIEGPAFPPHQTFESPGPLAAGYDFTLDKEAGTDRAIAWRIDTQDGAGGGSSTYYDREGAALRVEAGDIGSYLVFQAKDTAGAAVTGKVAGDWTVKFQRAGAASATAMTTPTVTEQDAGDIPGAYKLLLDEGTTTLTDGVLEEIVTYYLTCTGVQPITRHVLLTRPEGAYRRFTAVGADVNTLVFDAGASSVSGSYYGDVVHIIAGTGANQVRQIILYDGPSQTATVNQDWVTTPDSTSVVRQYASEAALTAGDLIDAMNADRPSVNAELQYARAVAVTNFDFPMTATDGTPATGKTVTAKIRRDGGSFTALAGSVTEVSEGWYTVAITGAEMDGDEIAFLATATGCLQTNMKIRAQS
jgi:hypothetical protein